MHYVINEKSQQKLYSGEKFVRDLTSFLERFFGGNELNSSRCFDGRARPRLHDSAKCYGDVQIASSSSSQNTWQREALVYVYLPGNMNF